MKLKIFSIMLSTLFLMSAIVNAELRTYRQFKDVATKENGKVSQSGKKADLFEYTYALDIPKKTITRVKIRRLDEPQAREDSTVYTILQKKHIWASEAGNGGRALIAIQKDGDELLELSYRYAFTMRVSPFSQVITGVYKRIYFDGQEHGRCSHKRK